MSPKAQQTHLDFVRLTAEEPSSLYFERFLLEGSDAWPTRYCQNYPALANWQGVGDLKRRLTHVAGAPDSRVLIAGRSAQLMALGARLLSRTCRKVFTTDFSWPGYENILRHELDRIGSSFHSVGLRRSVLREQLPMRQLIERLTQAFVNSRCDGLFLPAVDNLGIRLPIAEIVYSIRSRAELRFVVVDAAQAFAHVSLEDSLSASDFAIAGCHKWLGGYFPLGVAFYNQPGTRDLVDGTTTNMLERHELDDPVLRFCRQLAGSKLDGYSETVNLGPLFSCRGALADAPSESSVLQTHLEQQLENARLVAEHARKSGWRAVQPAQDLRSGILLLEPQGPSLSAGDAVRQHFLQADVAITAYDEGLARLAMPKQPLSASESLQIRHALEGEAPRDKPGVRGACRKAVFSIPAGYRVSTDTPIGWSIR